MKDETRLFNRVATAVTITAVLLGLSACGDGPSREELAASERTDQRLMELYDAIVGTSAERSAGAFLGNYALDAPVKECMNNLDYPYPIRYLDVFVGRQSTGAGGLWSRPLMLASTSVNAQVAAEASEDEQVLSNQPAESSVVNTEGYSVALEQCDKASGRYEQSSEPRDSDKLSGQLYEVISRIDDSVGDIGEYNACMKTAGYDIATEDYDGYDGLFMMLHDAAPPVEQIPEPKDEGGEAWQKYLALEQLVLEADRDCRASKHVEAMILVDDALTEFEDKNSAELAEVRHSWAGIVEEAAALGWTDRTEKYRGN